MTNWFASLRAVLHGPDGVDPLIEGERRAEAAARLERAVPLLAPHGRTAVRAARLAAWACVAAIAVLSLLPGDERPHTGLAGVAEHFIAYAGTGFVWQFAYLVPRPRIVGWIGLALASALFEVLQNFVPGRSPSAVDALASTAGLTFGVALGAVLAAALLPAGKPRC